MKICRARDGVGMDYGVDEMSLGKGRWARKRGKVSKLQLMFTLMR